MLRMRITPQLRRLSTSVRAKQAFVCSISSLVPQFARSRRAAGTAAHQRALCALAAQQSTDGEQLVQQFTAKYAPAGEENDSEAAFALWQSCVHCVPGASLDAQAAFAVQLRHADLVQQCVGRQQLAQVVFWGEVLSQQKSWEAVGAAWRGMHASLGAAASSGQLPLTPPEALEVHEGLLRALVLATPPTSEAIHAVQGLVRAVMDGGLAEAIAASTAEEGGQGGLHESWGESLTLARTGSILALPHWVLHESADDFAAVQATQGGSAADDAAADDSSGVIASSSVDSSGAAQRVQLYWDAFVWPNPAMEAAAAVWEESARSEIAPWWAQSTYAVHTWHALHSAAEGEGADGAGEGDFVALCAGKAQFAEDHIEALALGWAASGRAEYLSTLLEIASGWLEFAEEFGWAPLIQEDAEGDEGMDVQLGVAVPPSVLETPAAAARWAGSRLAGRRLLELTEADPAAWAGVLRHFEAMRGIALEAFDADEAAGGEEGGARGYLDAVAQDGSVPEGPMPPVPGLPQFAVRVLNMHAVLLPAMRRLREGGRQAAKQALREAGAVASPAQARLWELQAADPAKASSVESQVAREPARGAAGAASARGRFPTAKSSAAQGDSA